MMYRVITAFCDMQDERTLYAIGDVYPRDGYTPTKERLEELASSKNRVGVPLIVADEPQDEPKAEPKAEPKKRTRKRKTE